MRTANSCDSRLNSVELTENGKAIVKQSRKDFDSIDKAIFEGFSLTEIENLIHCLDRLQNNMEKAKEVI